MPRSLGERIKRARLRNGLAQVEVADKVGVTPAAVAQWEGNRTAPNEDNLAKLRAVIGGIHFVTQERTSSTQTVEETPEDVEQEDRVEASAYGVWLNRTRLSKGVSVPQLAEVSGVALPTVYAIESGRIQNPRGSTRKKLERALKTQIDPDVSKQMTEDATISGIGELTDFNPHDSQDIPTDPGVYVFYDITERAIYVGQTNNIKRRLKDYEEKFWFRQPFVQTAAFIRVDEKDQRKQIESVLIKFLKSNAVLNKQLVQR